MSPRQQFGSTWWGRAWVRALEGRARIDPNRLPRGRTYARQQRVLALDVAPGEITAKVQGRRATPYVVRLRVREFDEPEWELVVDAIASKAAHAAALLDGELLPEILDDAEAAGVDLLLGPGELVPTCSCPDWADPCKHAAAVCYLVADLLDDDPFALFLLRGRERDHLLAEVRDRRQAGGQAGGQAGDGAGVAGDSRADLAVTGDRPDGEGPGHSPRGVPAGASFTAPQPEAEALWALDITTPPERPGVAAALIVAPPDGSGIRGADLQLLANDAASRAWELSIGADAGGLDLTFEEDLARWAATFIGTPGLVDLAARSGVALRHLTRLGIAWKFGHREGVEVTEMTWDADDDLLEEGREALLAVTSRVTARGNRLTAGDLQLRVGRSGLWYRFEKLAGQWELDGPPAADPADLVTDRC